MSFAYHGFSDMCLRGNFNWLSGYFSALLVTDAFDEDPTLVYASAIPADVRPRERIILTGRTITDGAAGCLDIVFPAVPVGHTFHGIVVLKDTADLTTSPLVIFHNEGTGWPLDSNGGNIVVTVSTGADKLFRIGVYPAP